MQFLVVTTIPRVVHYDRRLFIRLPLLLRPLSPHVRPRMSSQLSQLSQNLFVFLKWTSLGFFYVYFRLFKQALQFLQQINVKQCPSSIRHWDSNPQPLEIESPPITTRPGLPPVKKFVTVSDYKSVACPTLVGPLTKILHLVGRSVSQCSSSNNISFHMHWI